MALVLPKAVSPLGSMLLKEVTARQSAEMQTVLKNMAEADGIPLDGSVHLNQDTMQWEKRPSQANLTLHRHDGGQPEEPAPEQPANV